jgi:hypothetical protein
MPSSQPINSWINDDIASDRLSSQFGSHVTEIQSERRNFSDDYYRNRPEKRDNERNDSSDRWGVRSRGRVRDVSPDRTRRSGNEYSRNGRSKQSSQRNVQNQILPNSPKEESKQASPPPKKPKRVVNEEDLSEGEIVDSD